MIYAFGCTPAMAAELGAHGVRSIVRIRRDILGQSDLVAAICGPLAACHAAGIKRVLLTLRWEHPTQDEVDVAPTVEESPAFMRAMRAALESDEWQSMESVILQVGNEPERMWLDEETMLAMHSFTVDLWYKTCESPNVWWSTAAITAGTLLAEPTEVNDRVAQSLRVIGMCLRWGDALRFAYHDLHLNIDSVETADRALVRFRQILALLNIDEKPVISSECSTVRDPEFDAGNTEGALETIGAFGNWLHVNTDVAAIAQVRPFGGDFGYGTAFDSQGRRQEPWFSEWRRICAASAEHDAREVGR